jgi:hypothetical protein
MPKFDFCIPTTGKIVPAGPDWFHEIKYDGYRLRIERHGITFAWSRAAAKTRPGAFHGSSRLRCATARSNSSSMARRLFSA